MLLHHLFLSQATNNPAHIDLENRRTKITVLCIAIFLLIFCTLGLPFIHWGFKTDDWGNVYHATTRNWSDWFGFFTEGSSEKVYHQSNLPPAPEAFFQGLYRPVSFIYYAIQHALFGFAPYGYFLVTIGLHALSTVMLFLLFLSFATTVQACIAALLFGFHPSLHNWLGWTSAQTYFSELFVVLLIIFLLLHFIKKPRWYLYVLACGLYLANLFLKEQTILLPLWLMLAYGIYQPTSLPVFKRAARAFRSASGFFLMGVAYVIARLQFFPLTAETRTLTFEPTWQSFITRMSSRFYDFVTYGNDLLGFSWLEQGNPLLKGSLIGLTLLIAGWLFYHNTQKKYVTLCSIGIILLSWPALLMHYQPRYIYMAIPWFLCLALILVCFYNGPRIGKKIVWFVHAVLLTILAGNTLFLTQHLKTREADLHIITTAFHKLVANPATQNRVLGFIALPSRWFAQGTAQAVWMLRNDHSLPVYQWGAPLNRIDGNLPDGEIEFVRTKNGFECVSQTPQILWFETVDGTKTDRIFIEIEEEYKKQNILFVAWDYKNKCFKIL